MPVSGLPLGLQLTADLNGDARLLPAAAFLYERLYSAARCTEIAANHPSDVAGIDGHLKHCELFTFDIRTFA